MQTAHGEVISRRQSVERMAELQQNKYQDLQATLPSELSMQLAEVALALGSAEDQVPPTPGSSHRFTRGCPNLGPIAFYLHLHLVI